ncbi:putative Trypsin [Deinococcus grandis]|uniref:Putative Trypsin n=1 Tax=Deinococcus grandis TaxID=57498 RepID=A0A100HL68_9DEIO|nr:hypothetical protein DEGR_05070 [Deinococcus grandis]GAQ22718.1 putative Trypsin [Deinococcus grandis]
MAPDTASTSGALLVRLMAGGLVITAPEDVLAWGVQVVVAPTVMACGVQASVMEARVSGTGGSMRQELSRPVQIRAVIQGRERRDMGILQVARWAGVVMTVCAQLSNRVLTSSPSSLAWMHWAALCGTVGKEA